MLVVCKVMRSNTSLACWENWHGPALITSYIQGSEESCHVQGSRRGAEKRNSNDRESVGSKWSSSWRLLRKYAIILVSGLSEVIHFVGESWQVQEDQNDKKWGYNEYILT